MEVGRDQIFQRRDSNIWMTIQFVAETARMLREKGRQRDFEFVADRSIELLRGNLQLKKFMLDQIIDKCCTGHGPDEYYVDMLKYFLALEKLFDDSVNEKKLRFQILVKIGQVYRLTGHYREALEYARKAENIVKDKIKDTKWEALCCEMFGSGNLSLEEYETAIQCFQKSLAICTDIGDQAGIARNNGHLGEAYLCSGEYRKGIPLLQISMAISTEINDLPLVISNNERLGHSYYSLCEYKKAIECYENSLTINTILGDRKGIARNYCNLGDVSRQLGAYKKAIENYEEALAISTEIGDQSVIASSNAGLGNIYFSLGKYENSIKYFEESLAVYTELGRRSGIASGNSNLGNVYLRLGECKKAIECFQIALKISSEIGTRDQIANSNGNLGNTCRKLGEYRRAIEYHQKSLDINTEIGNLSGIEVNYGNLGRVYFSIGDYERAIWYHQNGLTISTKIGNRSAIASRNGNLGNAHLDLGDCEKAIKYFEKSLEISTDIGDASGIADGNGSLGDAYLSLGDSEKAIKYFKKSLEINTDMGDASGLAAVNLSLGNVCRHLGAYEKSIEYNQRSLSISTEIGDRSGIARNCLNLGITYSQLVEYEKAFAFFAKSLEINVEIEDLAGASSCFGNIGFTYFCQGKSKIDKLEALSLFQQAVSYLKRSVNCNDRMFSRLYVDQNKISFTKEYSNRYVTLMCCFILMERIDAALLVIDLGKAKALHAFIEKRKKPESDHMADYTHKTWERIDSHEENIQIEEIERALKLRTDNSSIIVYAFNLYEFLNIWVVNGKNDINIFEQREFAKSYIFSLLKMLLDHLNVNLSRESSFHKLDSALTHSWQILELDRKPINEKSKCATEQTIFQPETTPSQKQHSGERIFADNTPEPTNSSEQILQMLHQILLPRAVKDSIKGTKLIIVPDEFLFFAPFCSLSDENGCPLSQSYSIQITPSLHSLVSSMTRSRDPRLGFALFVGNPTVGKVSFRGNDIKPDELRSATEEVTFLAPLFESQPLVEGEATKERVLKCIDGASIIHIAAHGDQEHGEIFLAPNPNVEEQLGTSIPIEESYLLRELDILDINIRARLVVLCCCHTGSGKVSSEGVVGLARAFLAAGARSVLATLWPIHDEGTKEFMKHFYDEVCQETSVCEALRRTMNLFQKHQNKDFSSFKIWAPFTIYGEDVKFTQRDIEEIKQQSRAMSY